MERAGSEAIIKKIKGKEDKRINQVESGRQ